MTASRESACAALFTLLSGAYAWKNTPSRRLVVWDKIPRNQRPAFFQSEGGTPQKYMWTGPHPKRSFTVRAFIYFFASDASPGAPQMTAIMDAIDVALAPAGKDILTGRQTLGGVAHHARIADIPVTDAGDLDGEGVVVVDIEIMLP